MQASFVRPYQCWNWAGDEIVPDPIIPAARPVPRTGHRGYAIDIREFLSIRGNAVIRERLGRLTDRLPAEDRSIFRSRSKGAFDFRMRKVVDFLAHHLAYKPGPGARAGRARPDDWLFPDETLANGGGDCEDLAFVLAAMLEASGISSYCLRVALGRVVDHSIPGGRGWDHAWVVYLDERGAWRILEPMKLSASRPERSFHRLAKPGKAQRVPDLSYIPYYVFNHDHLWKVRTRDFPTGIPFHTYLRGRRFWTDFDPSFAIGVHEEIYDIALRGMPADTLAQVKSHSFWVDVNTLSYDPRDHFDFAYIKEGWTRVTRRLQKRTIEDFGLAVHAIADFYAHTLYADYAPRRPNGALELLDPTNPTLLQPPEYNFQPFAPLPGCSKPPADAAALWKGELISGQWWRWYTTFPDELQDSADFKKRRRCLPDHDTLAVDGPTPKSSHRRYNKNEYPVQYGLRKQAAIEHIRKAYQATPPSE